jgi:anti-sigma factor RsiW
MACPSWTAQLDAYLDGELSAEEARAAYQHLRECPACAAESAARLQEKRAIREAAPRYSPEPALRARIQKTVAPRPALVGRWIPVFATCTVALLIVGAVVLRQDRWNQRDDLSELVDQHVATLASANPVDVISTDRHTVKPWFEGRIPFTFNLPELQGSEFALIGGKVAYLGQSPGAELLFRVRKHQLSVFIFQERKSMDLRTVAVKAHLSFEVRTWAENGLRYVVIGDASAQDLDTLSELLRTAK